MVTYPHLLLRLILLRDVMVCPVPPHPASPRPTLFLSPQHTLFLLHCVLPLPNSPNLTPALVFQSTTVSLGVFSPPFPFSHAPTHLFPLDILTYVSPHLSPLSPSASCLTPAPHFSPLPSPHLSLPCPSTFVQHCQTSPSIFPYPNLLPYLLLHELTNFDTCLSVTP